MRTGLIGLGARKQRLSVSKEVTNLKSVGVSWQTKRLLSSEGLYCIQSAVIILSEQEGKTVDGRWQFSANISRFRPSAKSRCMVPPTRGSCPVISV